MSFSYTEQIYTGRVNLKPNQLHKNYLKELEKKLKAKYEGKCHPKMGYVKRGSMHLISKNQGYLAGSQLVGDITFKIKFQCLVTQPIKGDVIHCIITENTDIGLVGVPRETLPYTIIVSNNPQIETNKEHLSMLPKFEINDVVEVRVVNSMLVPPDEDWRQARYNVVATLVSGKVQSHSILQLPSIEQIDDVILLTAFTSIDINDAYKGEYEPWKNRKDFTESDSSYKNLAMAKKGIERINSEATQVLRTILKQVMDSTIKFQPKDLWSYVKTQINPYEKVDSKEVSMLKQDNVTVSRAFYKMHEIIKMGKMGIGGGSDSQVRFSLLKNKNMKILNIAESPGGFIQALIWNRRYQELNSFKDNFVAMSIQESGKSTSEALWSRLKDKTTASARKYEEFKKVEFKDVESGSALGGPSSGAGSDGSGFEWNSSTDSGATVHFMHPSNGDITNPNNYKLLMKIFEGDNKADLVTADGGFGVDDHPELQEILHYRLFWAETIIALSTQKEGGSFVLKVHDILTKFTVDMLAILSTYYSEVYLYKPKTSRQANSEKYVICTGFDPERLKIRDLSVMLKIYESNIWNDTTKQVVNALGGLTLSDSFTRQLKLYNTQFVSNETDNIRDGLMRAESLIEAAKQDNVKALKEIASTRKRLMEKQSKEFIQQMGLQIAESYSPFAASGSGAASAASGSGALES